MKKLIYIYTYYGSEVSQVVTLRSWWSWSHSVHLVLWVFLCTSNKSDSSRLASWGIIILRVGLWRADPSFFVRVAISPRLYLSNNVFNPYVRNRLVRILIDWSDACRDSFCWSFFLWYLLVETCFSEIFLTKPMSSKQVFGVAVVICFGGMNSCIRFEIWLHAECSAALRV